LRQPLGSSGPNKAGRSRRPSGCRRRGSRLRTASCSRSGVGTVGLPDQTRQLAISCWWRFGTIVRSRRSSTRRPCSLHQPFYPLVVHLYPAMPNLSPEPPIAMARHLSLGSGNLSQHASGLPAVVVLRAKPITTRTRRMERNGTDDRRGVIQRAATPRILPFTWPAPLRRSRKPLVPCSLSSGAARQTSRS
jgi:hypothetical protein